MGIWRSFLVCLLFAVPVRAQEAGTMVDATNGVDLTFDNDNLPILPDGWGATSQGYELSATEALALSYTTGLGNRTGYVTALDYLVAETSMASGTFISFHVAKEISDLEFFDGATPIAYYLQLYNDAGTFKFQFITPGENGTPDTYTWAGSVTAGHAYRHDVIYDLLRRHILWRVNGDLVMSVGMNANSPASIDTLIIGSSAGSTGRSTTFFVDRISHTAVRAGAPRLGRVRVPGSADFSVASPSYSIFHNPAPDDAISTYAAYRADDAGYTTAVQRVRAAGAQHLQETFLWSDVEPTVGNYDWDEVDRLIAAGSGKLPLQINIAPVALGVSAAKTVPADLAATAWDDAAMIAAYKNMLTALDARLGTSPLWVLTVGDEVDLYFDNHLTEIDDYGTFLIAVKTHARTLFGTNPFKVTVNFRFGATESWSTYRDIANVTDIESFTYYDSTFSDDFNAALISTLEGSRFILQEIGFPTNAELGFSDAMQEDILNAAMTAMDFIADQGYLLAATWSRLNDINTDVLEDFGYTDFALQVHTTLGLRNIALGGKPAWFDLVGFLGGSPGDVPPVDPIDCTMSFAETASETFSASAGSGTVVVNLANPSCDFFTQIPGAETWLTVTPSSSAGTATVTYTVTANAGVDTRTATFEVVHDDTTLSFQVVQQGSDPLPNTPPAAANTPSPADDAVGQDVSVTLSANAADDYLSCSILFGTASPPTAETDLGANCSYAPPSLAYSTQYFWILKRTNAYGTTPSAEWSFTTKADPTPVDPDPTCTSNTTSATGVAYVHWTPCRQDTWDQMEADYIAACPAGVSAAVCAATPATWGGRLFKENKQAADGAVSGDIGEFDTFIVQATGCATTGPTGVRYAQSAHDRLILEINRMMGANEPAPYDMVEVTDNNAKRIYPLKFIAILEAIKPCITTAEYDAVNLRIAQFLQSVRLNGWGHTGLRIGDWDNDLGGCFGIWVHHLLNPTMQLAIDNSINLDPVTNVARNNIGGLDPVADMDTYLPSNAGATCRDYIKWWTTITPNSSGEGIEYILADLTFIIRGRDAVMTLTGEDHFPELLTLMEGEANLLLHMWSPDLRNQFDYGDTEQFGSGWRRAQGTVALMELAGALQGTTAGRKLHDLLVELEAQYPLGTLPGLTFRVFGSNPLTFYNPYDTQVEWRDGLSYFDAPQRLTFRKSHISSTTASQFQVYSGGPQKWSTTLARPLNGDHDFWTWGDWSLYCDGGLCMSHPHDYAGPHVKGADGANGPIIYGRARVDAYNRLTARHDSTYSAVMAQQGGSRIHNGWCGSNPADAPPYLNEWTRNWIYLPGDTVIVYDRGDVETSIVNYDTCYHPTIDRFQIEPFKNIDKELIVNHMPTTPTQTGDVFEWTTSHSTPKNAKMTFLFPTANLDHTIVDETEARVINASDPDFGYEWKYNATYTVWEFHYSQTPAQLGYHVRTRSTANDQFNTFLSVFQFGAETAGALVAKEDAGKVQGVHLNPASGNDVLALFNSEQGATTLTDSYYSNNHQTEVPPQHLRETGFTIAWTPTTANTLVLLHGLNPANTWTYAIDGGAPVSITPEDGSADGEVPGHWSGTIAATSGVAHTIVVTGS